MNNYLGKKSVLGLSFGMVALVCTGCTQQTGTVTGTVTYKGKPLPGGSVTFATDTGVFTGPIDSDGKYTANVPAGNAKVTVFYNTGPKMAPRGGGGRGGAPKDLPPEAQKAIESSKQKHTLTVPPKYNNPDTSGLTLTVQPGTNPPYNIDLKD